MSSDGQPRTKRVPIMLTERELEMIDDWRFTNKINTRAEAIRRLVMASLGCEVPHVQ
jgi:hypothetical protein